MSPRLLSTALHLGTGEHTHTHCSPAVGSLLVAATPVLYGSAAVLCQEAAEEAGTDTAHSSAGFLPSPMERMLCGLTWPSL